MRLNGRQPLGKITVERALRFFELDKPLVGQDKNIEYAFCSIAPEATPNATRFHELENKVEEPSNGESDTRVVSIACHNLQNLLVVIEEQSVDRARIGRKCSLDFGATLIVRHGTAVSSVGNACRPLKF